MDKEIYEGLEKVKMSMLRELCSYGSKTMNTQLFHEAKELAEATKDVCKLMMMLEEKDMSMNGESYRGYSNDGRNGGYSMNGGSYGGYSYAGNNMGGRGYSGHQNDAEYMNQLYMLLDKAPNDMARAQISGLIRESEARR